MNGQLPFEGDTFIESQLENLKIKLNLTSCIETGTQFGATTRSLYNLFGNVISIEADENFIKKAVDNLKDIKAILLLGKSEDILPQLEIEDNVLFYLDAHGCDIGGCPLKKELEIIASKKLNNVCIAIHDFKVPNKDFGFDAYDYVLCIEEIRDYLKLVYPKGYMFYYNSEADGAKRGIIYIYNSDENN